MTAKRLLHLPMLLLLCGAALPAAWSAEEGAGAVETAARPLRFIRVFVPTDQVRLEDFSRDWRIKHWPVEPQEFEQLLATAQTRGRAERAPGAAIVSARYEARLDGDALVDGEAWLEVIHPGEGRAMLPLDPCGLAIHEASWTGEPVQPAKLGLGPDGRLAVVAEQSGRLHCAWSLRGRRDATGTVQFAWQPPPSPTSRLVLRLPAGMAPVAEQAVVSDEGPEGEQFRRFRIEVGGQGQLAIRVVPTQEGPEQLPSTRVRQATDYRFSLSGLDASVRLELDVFGEPLTHVALALDPGLRPVKALYGETPLEWTWTSSDSQGGGTRLGLDFPEPIRGPERIVRLQLLGPVEFDRRWKLPSIRAQRMFWEEGEATLSVAPPLVLQELVPVKGRQSSKIESLPGPRSAETVRVQYFAPDGGAEIVLTRPESPLHLDGGTTVEFSGGETVARLDARAYVTQGERFQIEADVAPQWTVDSVEVVPAEMLSDWSEDEEETTSRLTIQLAGPLPQRDSASPPVRLRINARRVQSALGRAVGIADLVPLRFRGVVEGRRILCLRAREPYQLKLIGTETRPRVDPQSLDAASLALLAPRPGSLLLEEDAGAGGLRVSLTGRKPGYSATVRVEANVSDHSLTESYWMRCVPEAGRRVDRVLVRFSRRRPDPLRWSLGAEDEDHWTVRRLTPGGRSEPAAASEGETWEFRLDPPRSVPFEFRATRSTPSTEEEVVSLTSLPEAKDPQATVVVRSTGSAAVEIENHRLKPIPAPDVPVDQYNTVRGSFRYDPVQDVEAATEPALAISRRKAEDVQPSAWAWSCRLESQYEPSGTARHLATYRLESAGGERVRLTLPPGVAQPDVRGVWVNDDPVTCRPGGTEAQGAMDLSLPPGKRFAVLSICFATTGGPLGVVDSIMPTLPQIDVPVMSREWTVWLPPGFRADEAALRAQARGRETASWTTRLFGPLGRPPAREPFDPFSLEDWRRVLDDEPLRRPAEGQAVALVQRLGERSTPDRFAQGTEGLDWGTLLSDASIQRLLAAAGNRRVELELLVDRRALARSGIAPRTPVRLPVAETPAGRGVDLLEQENAALLVHARALVVTTAAEAAVRHAQLSPVGNDELTPLESGRLWWVGPGPLEDRIARAAAGEPDDAFVPVHLWQQQPPEPQLPWSDSRSPGFAPVDARGWTACRLEIPAQSSLRLPLAHRDTLGTFPWVAFLAAIGLGWWTAARRPVVLAGALGVFGTAAWLLPETYAPIAAGAVLGTLFVAGLRLIFLRRQPGSSPVGSRRPSGSSTAPKASTLLGIVLLAQATVVIPGSSARGGEPKPAPLPAWWPAYGVLIPVDEQMQPTGEKYQVPLDFYNQLRELATAATAESRGWLLGPATYRGELVRQAAPDRLALGELRATFHIELFSSSARVVIPFGQEGPDLSSDRALLDGQPISYELRENALVFNVSEKGAHRLELSLRPAVRTEEGRGGVDVAIPRLATSRLELTVPPDLPAIEVPSAAGWTGIEREADSPRVEAQLGPVDRLSIRWQREGGAGGAGRTADVEELLWLKVEPESVLVNARYVLNAVEGPVGELRLTADSRLRLRPIEGIEIASTPGHLQTIRLRLSEPVTDRRTIEATFVVPDSSGIGNLRMPRLEVVGARTTRRWMAVSVHPSLEAEEQMSEALETVAVPDFVDAWGEIAVQPRSAYSLPSGEPSWSMTTRPREPEVTVDQTQAWSFASGEARLQLEARLAATGGYRFQYRLSAPAAMAIESASVLEGGVERADRWRTAPDGTITIFLKRATTGEQALSLRGRLPTPTRRKLDLPTVQLEGANVQSSRIQIFRYPDALVSVNNKTAGLVEDQEPLIDANGASRGRLVKSFREDGSGSVLGTLALSPNRPRVRGEQVTLLRSDGDGWEVEVDFRLQVDRGVLDEIRLIVPDSCRGPFVLDPPATWEEAETAGQRRLLVRPDAAITGEYRFTVSSPLDLPPGEQVSVPQVTVDQVDLERHLLLLPTQSGLRQVVWETRGVRRAELPEDFPAPPVGADALAVYQVEEAPFRAILRPLSGEPDLLFADVRLDWQADGKCRGLAVFDLEPAGTSACSLRLPAGCRLVQVAVEGMPSAAVRNGESRWRVPLSRTTFPQRIEVLYEGTAPALGSSGVVRLESPVLEGLPARQTLWTVAGPADYGLGRPEALRSVSLLQQELLRLQNVEALMERGARMTPEVPERMDRWYRRWARRWAASCREVEHQRALSRPIEAAGMPPPDHLPWDRLPSQVAVRLRRGDLLAAVSAEASVAAGLAQLWLRTVDRAAPANGYVGEGGSASITLRYRRVEGTGLGRRWVGAAGWAALALLAMLGLRWGLFAPLACRWPYLLGVIVGLAWWLWLWPSILGWGIVLASLAGSFRWKWKRPGQGGSAIVTLMLAKR